MRGLAERSEMGRLVKYTDILDRAKSRYRSGSSVENIELMIRGHAGMTSTDPEPTVQAFKEWVETEGREYRREAMKKSYQKNKEKRKTDARKFYQDHIEERREYDRKRRQDPEYRARQREYQKAWRAANPDKVKANNDRNNARQKAERLAEKAEKKAKRGTD